MGNLFALIIENLRGMDERSFEENSWKVIGAGGFGQVFKARHCRLGKDVAVKIIGPDTGIKNVKDDSAREAKAMLYAESPYIVKYLGVFKGVPPHTDMKVVGVVMDLEEGGSLLSLQEKRERQPLPWPLVFRLVHQVALGMNYLHSLKPAALIHKDLKPDNILLDSDLNVKITDFGLAKFADAVTASNLERMATAFYSPPEAEQGGATCAYDVYSYAVVVWTLLNPAHIIRRGVESYPVRPSLEAVKKIDAPGLEELVELMERCWNEDREQRPTFAECTATTGRLYEMYYKSGINDAVRTVQLEKDGVHQDGVQQDGVHQDGVQQDGVQQDGVHQDGVILKEPKSDFRHLTLDTSTTHRFLSLSEKNRKVTTSDGQDQSYPRHRDRFDVWSQVLCTESLTGRCYWEVEWSGVVGIAVTYRGIGRKGEGRDCGLGLNDKSWSLDCSDRRYIVTHNSKVTALSVSPSRGSNRAAVYLDCPAGTLSFYEVSSEDTLTHLYTFRNKFTEALYAGFGFPFFSSSSTVHLCEQR